MTPVFQNRFTNNQGDKGNCQTAAIASLLDLPIERVPYFFDFPDFWDAVFAFLWDHGYEYYGNIQPKLGEPIDWESMPGVDGYFIVAGPSPRWKDSSHAVIYKNGKMVHDPHPDGTGILFIDCVDDIRRRP